ncbi:MAG: RNA polymerase sigma factor [Bosea sp. (in: a-proteobacteria)]
MGVDIRLQIVTMLPRLRRFAHSLAGAADRADDLVQATCERALAASDSWQPGTRLDSWLYRIMQNLWVDDMRRLKTRGHEQRAEEMFELVGENGIATAEARIAAGEVLQALTRLPEDQRAIVSLVCIEELSYREVASILDIPIGTVMSRLARGRRALGAMLGMAGAETEPAGA